MKSMMLPKKWGVSDFGNRGICSYMNFGNRGIPFANFSGNFRGGV